MSYMFAECLNIKSVSDDCIFYDNATNLNNMFCDCKSLTSWSAEFMLSKREAIVTDARFMFFDCIKLNSVDFNGIRIAYDNTNGFAPYDHMFEVTDNTISDQSVDGSASVKTVTFGNR